MNHAKKTLEKGDACFVILQDSITGATIQGIATDPHDKVCPEHYLVSLHAPIYGTAGVRTQDAFPDKESAMAEALARQQKRIERYKSAMPDIKSLIQFAVEAVSRNDEEEAKAIRERAQELDLL